MRRPLLLSALASVASGTLATAPLAQVPSTPPANAQVILQQQTPGTLLSQRTFLRGTSTISNRTEFYAAAMEAPFNWVRVQYCNSQVSSYTVDKTYAQSTRETYVDTSNRIVVSAAQATNTTAGFVVNDTITLDAGGGTASTVPVLTVTDVDSTGKVLGWVISTAGAFSVAPSGVLTKTATSGAGTGTLTVTATMKNGFSWIPIDAGGNTLTMQPVYFNGVQNAVTASQDPTQLGIDPRILDNPAGVQTGWGTTTQASVVVPAGTASHPACVLSDWTYVPSVARQDGSFRPYLTVRSYTLTGGTNIAINKTDTYSWNDPNLNFGREVLTSDGGGDQSTSASPATAQVLRMLVSGVYAIATASAVNVMACGDSLTQGHMGHNSYSTGATLEAASGYYSWANIATSAASRAGRPVSFFNSGWTAQTTAQFYARCIEDIYRVRPNVVFIAPFSPNDAGPPTAATVASGWAKATALADAAKRLGATPVFITAIPLNSTATCGDDNNRTALNALIRTSGFLVADFDTLITNGACPARMLAQYDSGDALHPNAAGYSLEAMQAALPTLQLVIGP